MKFRATAKVAAFLGVVIFGATLFNETLFAQSRKTDTRSETARSVDRKVTAKEKRLIKTYTSKVSKFKPTVKGKKRLATDWFVTGIRVGNQAEFRSLQSEEKAVRWSVDQALNKNKKRAWKILARFADQSSAEKYVTEMNGRFQQLLVEEQQIAARNAELARQRAALLARQRNLIQSGGRLTGGLSSGGGHSGGSC